jgi:hypothetical protein
MYLNKDKYNFLIAKAGKFKWLILTPVLLFINKILTLIIILVLLEFIKEYFSNLHGLPVLPFPFLEIAIIISSYYYTPFFTIFLVVLYLFNKVLFGKLREKYFTKAFLMFLLSLLIIPFKSISLVILGPTIYILRIILESFVDSILFGDPYFKYLPSRTISTVFVLSLFYLFVNLGLLK